MRPLSSSSRARWICSLCCKALCSKRSYEEHMNIHTNRRPFTCNKCKYAAASEMTLRRHVLRNHVPKERWGYQCPYCPEPFMEPASYQQHVMTKHFGQSATLGCPQSQCPFTTKCAKHFRDHLSKHVDVMQFPFDSNNLWTNAKREMADRLMDRGLHKFMVDDEFGSGVGKSPLTLPPFKGKFVAQATKDVEKLLGPEAAQKARRTLLSRSLPSMTSTQHRIPSLKPALQYVIPAARPPSLTKQTKIVHRTPVRRNIIIKRPPKLASPAPEVGCEVVLEANEGPKRLPDGQMELELD